MLYNGRASLGDDDGHDDEVDACLEGGRESL